MPNEDRGSSRSTSTSSSAGRRRRGLFAAYLAIQQYLAQLVAAKRVNPTDDVLSDLPTAT